MSTYFYSCCHDCKVFFEVGNSGLTIADELTTKWANHFKHVGHSIETNSEYVEDCLFEEIIRNRTDYKDITKEADTFFKSG